MVRPPGGLLSGNEQMQSTGSCYSEDSLENARSVKKPDLDERLLCCLLV